MRLRNFLERAWRGSLKEKTGTRQSAEEESAKGNTTS